jgi:hypothetical protein
MHFRVSFQNSGGELDFFRADNGEDAARKFAEHLQHDWNTLQDGDRFVVTEYKGVDKKDGSAFLRR